MRNYFFLLFLFFLVNYASGQRANIYQNHWQIANEKSIQWDLKNDQNLPHQDNIEMSGKRVSAIVTYSLDTAKMLTVNRHVIFPQLRTLLKTTDPRWYVYRAYLKEDYSDDILPQIVLNGEIYVPGPVVQVQIDGTLQFQHEASKDGLQLTRTFLPSPTERLFVEQWILTNTSTNQLELQVANQTQEKNVIGAKGRYAQTVTTIAPDNITLAAGKSQQISIQIAAQMEGEALPTREGTSVTKERQAFINQVTDALVLETPDKVLNTLFQLSKIRATESIFESKLGLVHSPGGGRYYCGFWANDQAEYINPFFPYLGYELGNKAALNIYRLYLKEINPEFKNIRYSFEMEGDAPINPLDRGDAAMIGYGVAQYILAIGDRAIAKELLPLLEWCLEYCDRQLNDSGVVASESDEMEGRIETGKANLATSALYYGALNLSVDLMKDMDKNDLSERYEKQATALEKAIENYFGAKVEGLETYKYYKKHKNLRHWICLPLVVGINERKDGTVEALFDRLWTDNGVHVEKNSENPAISKIFWDRGTLYALRGTLLAGATEISYDKLRQFSEERLLGKRVPYVVEAYPEGNMAHLSAESALYCRVFTEGLFGIVPTGLRSFEFTPRLPKDWDEMALRKVRAFQQNFDIEVEKNGKRKLTVRVKNDEGQALFSKKIKRGDTVEMTF
ncbi:MAG: six-hairpin glycosidase-like protein [Bacteroidota bacterium]